MIVLKALFHSELLLLWLISSVLIQVKPKLVWTFPSMRISSEMVSLKGFNHFVNIVTHRLIYLT